jgi:hypothetical protein
MNDARPDPRELTKQEQDYLLQILMQRPLLEALPLYLKMTGQQLAPLAPPAMASPTLVPTH